MVCSGEVVIVHSHPPHWWCSFPLVHGHSNFTPQSTSQFPHHSEAQSRPSTVRLLIIHVLFVSDGAVGRGFYRAAMTGVFICLDYPQCSFFISIISIISPRKVNSKLCVDSSFLVSIHSSSASLHLWFLFHVSKPTCYYTYFSASLHSTLCHLLVLSLNSFLHPNHSFLHSNLPVSNHSTFFHISCLCLIRKFTPRLVPILTSQPHHCIYSSLSLNSWQHQTHSTHRLHQLRPLGEHSTLAGGVEVNLFTILPIIFVPVTSKDLKEGDLG